MRRLLVLLLALALLTACSGQPRTAPEPEPTEPTPVTEAASAPEADPTVLPEPEGETASSAGYLNVVTFRNIAVRAVDQSSETDDIGYLNAEYMAAKDIGIGLQMNAFTMRLKKPDDFELKDNEFYGIQRLGIQLALNYYF